MAQTPNQKKTSPAQRYMQKCIQRYQLDVNKNTEPEIIAHLENNRPYARYIKDLILKDMEAQKKER